MVPGASLILYLAFRYMTGTLSFGIRGLYIHILDTNFLSVILNLKDKFNTELVNSVLFYLRAFLLSRHENQLEIYINYNDLICKKIYSTDLKDDMIGTEDDDFGLRAFFTEEIAVLETKNATKVIQAKSSNLSLALSLILCRNNYRRINLQSKSSTILIVNESDTVSNSQYVQFMNVVFEAQRTGIKINVLDCHLRSDMFSGPENGTGHVLLKQASSISSGFYLIINSIPEVIPALFQFCGISPTSAEIFSQPKQKIMDFRGSCFCHGKIVDIGFVCSVCLSGMCLLFSNSHEIILIYSFLFIQPFLQSL
jgi:transcription initiation factor TFIIH subunit 3